MNTLKSKDKTTITFEKQGTGPALIIVDGALSTRSGGSKAELAKLLSPSFTVYRYDRRGRGASGDTLPYSVEREIEDIDALIDAAGGSACVYGHSSGGCLALEATVRLGAKIKKLAIYEAPYNNDPAAQAAWRDYLKNLKEALDSGRRGDAVALFMAYVGMPEAQIEGMRQATFWAGMEAIAPTLAYDHAAIMGDATIPVERAARVGVPTLVAAGSASFPFMRETASKLAKIIPQAEMVILDGQAHDVSAQAIAPVLSEFLQRDHASLRLVKAHAGRP